MSDLMSLWTQCLMILEEEVTPVGFNTWIKDINPVSMTDSKITLSSESHAPK